jgi:hypothetical protein
MGGYGSGRYPNKFRPTVDECQVIDVEKLRQWGCLEPGWRGTLPMGTAGTVFIDPALEVEDGYMRVSSIALRSPTFPQKWESIVSIVSIVSIPGRIGGTRPYILCPGNAHGGPCNRRVVKLYDAGRGFACRACNQLTYRSQRERPWDRALRRAGKVRARLGSRELGAAVPPRPKGMWRRRYSDLCQTAVAALAAGERALLASDL